MDGGATPRPGSVPSSVAVWSIDAASMFGKFLGTGLQSVPPGSVGSRRAPRLPPYLTRTPRWVGEDGPGRPPCAALVGSPSHRCGGDSGRDGVHNAATGLCLIKAGSNDTNLRRQPGRAFWRPR